MRWRWHNMNKKSLILSLLFPILSIIISVILLILFHISSSFIIILGVICSGSMPMLFVMLFKVDISEFVFGKIFFAVVLLVGVFFSWSVFNCWLIEKNNILILPVLIFIAEVVFAITRKTNFKTKICLIMSSLTLVYLGWVIDLCRAVSNAFS